MTDIPTALEINCETGEVVERPLTTAEINQRQADAQAWAAQEKSKQDAAALHASQRASGRAKLLTLGFTQAEIDALLS